MGSHLDIEKITQELAEDIQAAAWDRIEPEEPPNLLNQWLVDLKNYSGRVPVHGPIVIREKEPTKRPPNTSVWKVTPGE